MKPADILRALDRPDIRRPGHAADEEVWVRGTTKVVVVPERQIIVTVAKTTEEDADVIALAG